MKTTILICCIVSFLTLSAYGVWFWKTNFFDPKIEEKIEKASALKAQSLAEVLSEKIAAIKVNDRTRVIQERLLVLDRTLNHRDAYIQQINILLHESDIRNKDLGKENLSLKEFIQCKENQIHELELQLSHRNYQIIRLKHCRDQLNAIKNHFKYHTSMTQTVYQELMAQTNQQKLP